MLHLPQVNVLKYALPLSLDITLFIFVSRSGTYEIARGYSHCMWVFFYFLLVFIFDHFL